MRAPEFAVPNVLTADHDLIPCTSVATRVVSGPPFEGYVARKLHAPTPGGAPVCALCPV